jgi:hypothetical protein
MKRTLILISVSVCILSSCASTVNGLQKATARNIDTNYLSTEIEITDVDRQAMNVDWVAKTPDGKSYRCTADDMVRQVKCR